MKFKKKLLLAKLEAEYGTDPVPDGSNAIETNGLSIDPYQGDTVTHDVDRPTLGASAQINTAPYVTLSFDVALSGSGDAETAPGYGVLLRACGMSETLVPAPDDQPRVEYQPVSDGYESVSLYFNQDGQRHKATGCRGTVKFGFSKGGLPKLSFSFTGLWHAPEVATMPAGILTAFKVPLPVNSANSTIDVHGYAAKAESLDIDLGNDVKFRDVINSQSVQITNREASGSLTIEAPNLATKNYFAEAASHAGITLGEIVLTHGKTAGAIIEVKLKDQLSGISMGDSDGILTYSMDAKLIPTDAGDDEFLLITR